MTSKSEASKHKRGQSEILPLSTFVIPAQAGIHSSASAERTLFVGLIDSKTSSRFKMDPCVRKDDEQKRG
ncbi:TPA: hypothetical protein I7701_23710, partial [Vibrio vulnificus]|nr:hypothetical protein [Vibrio vulnificus]